MIFQTFACVDTGVVLDKIRYHELQFSEFLREVKEFSDILRGT